MYPALDAPWKSARHWPSFAHFCRVHWISWSEPRVLLELLFFSLPACCVLRQLDWTPLHAAANCPSVDSTAVLELLLSTSAAVDARDGVCATAWGMVEVLHASAYENLSVRDVLL